MALDLNKEISVGGKKDAPAKKAAAVYPSKTSMNFVVDEKSSVNWGRIIPVVLIVAVLAVLFVKFGVLDFMEQVNAKQAELSSAQMELAMLESAIADYDEVESEYNRYEEVSSLFDEDQVNALDALALVDQVVAPVATVQSVNLADNTLTIDVQDASLEGVGDLVSSLYERPEVAEVVVSTAQNQSTTANVAAVLTVTMQVAQEAASNGPSANALDTPDAEGAADAASATAPAATSGE